MCVPQQLAGVEGERRVSVWGFSSFEGKTPKGYQDISIKVLQKKKFLPFEFPSISRPTLSRLPEKKSGEPNKKITHRKRESGKVRSRAHWWAGKESPHTRSRRRRFCLYFDLKTKVWDKIPNRARNILFESYLEALIGPSLCWLLVERRADEKLQKKNSREIFQKW